MNYDTFTKHTGEINLDIEPRIVSTNIMIEERNNTFCSSLDSEIVCIICYQPYVDTKLELPCGHNFCYNCLVELNKEMNTRRCPKCRNENETFWNKLFQGHREITTKRNMQRYYNRNNENDSIVFVCTCIKYVSILVGCTSFVYVIFLISQHIS